MSRQARHDWFSSRNRSNGGSGHGVRSRRTSHRRPLRLEPLEDRRLLAITIDTLVDENDGIAIGGVSLRDALAAATSGETIDFAVTGTILLEHGELTIDQPLTIDGPGADLLTIDASGNDPSPDVDDGDGSRVFRIDDGSFSAPLDVEINGLTLTGGDIEGDGGAIENRENLHLVDSALKYNAATGNGGGIFHTGGMATLSTVAITHNRAQEGGGVYNIGDVLHAFNSEISSNHAAAGGGGILNWLGGELLVSESTLDGNSATDGGAIMNRAADFTVVGSTLSGNVATNSGGAIRNSGGTGTLFGSTASGNSAKYGAGVYVDTELNQTTTISNSTISGNTASDGGGGVYNFVGHVVLQFSTIADNSAQLGRGGGVVSWGDPAETLTEVYSTIVAGNWDPDGFLENDFDLVGGPLGGPFDTIASLGYNLVQSGNGLDEFDATGDLTGIDPLLGPLADNGGPLLTHALRVDSPALDAGNPSDEAGVGIVPVDDQRGAPYSRVFDADQDSIARIDIGAFESDDVFFVVDSVDDVVDGDYSTAHFSLREAIDLANDTTEGTAHILFAPELTSEGPNVLMLWLGQFDVTNRMIVEGPGADRLAINAQGNSRIFDVNDDVNPTLQDVRLSGLTLTGGFDGGGGGAIFSQERLTVRDSVITGNSAQWGGGIYNAEFGDLTLLRSQITDNDAIEPVPGAMGSGGGLYNWGGTARVTDSTISGNESVSHGGGILNANHGTLTVTRSTVSGNNAAENGGGLINGDGDVSIISSTISGNQANDFGGGLFVGTPGASTTTINSSTISGNMAPLGGAGILVDSGHAIIEFSTITENNSNDFAGSGVRASAAVQVRSSIIAGNHHTDAASAGPFDFESNGYNLIGEFGLGNVFNQVGDEIIGTAGPLLGPLADNGGPTWTHALLPGSPAIDAGDPNAVGGIGGVPMFDQRGSEYDRVRAGDAAEDIAIDKGAFEVQQFMATPALPGDYNLNETVDAADYTVWRDTLGAAVTQFAGADGDGDGLIDQDDYQVWKDHFGESLPGSGGATQAAALAGAASIDGLIIVTTLEDETDVANGLTSLREAIFAANIVGGPNTIQFAESLYAEGPTTILLTLGELLITDAVTINGPGAELLTIDASGNDANPETTGNGTRIFHVNDSLSNTSLDVQIEGLTLTGGDVADNGGAILSREKLLASNLRIVGNSAGSGGAFALYIVGSSSTVTDCFIAENKAASDGGAIIVQASNTGGIFSIVGNTIVGNSAKRGGAIYAGDSIPGTRLDLFDNQITGNSASFWGGAIFLSSQTAPRTTIRSSAISGNTAQQKGGGLYVINVRDLTIIDSTISNNRSLSENFNTGRGGGIYSAMAELSVVGSTITGNSAAVGGGIFSRNGDLAISFSTIADNIAKAGDGGGVYSNLDRLSIVGSTISGNTALGVFSQLGRGGGLLHTTGPVTPTTILDTNFVENSSTNSGGGAHFRTNSDGGAPSVALTNTNFTGNSSNVGGGLSLTDFVGTLVIEGGALTGNQATSHGGGGYGGGYSLFITGTTITGNHAAGNGGGWATSANARSSTRSISFVDATIDHNSAGSIESPANLGFGGGIYVSQGSVFMTLLDSVVAQNSARVGGGIARGGMQAVSGLLSVIDSTISGNTVHRHGGGVYNVGGAVSFSRSTIANNASSPAPGAAFGHGGGIFSRQADVSLVESTLSGNAAHSGKGGGIYILQTGDLTVTASTISGNSANQDGGGVWDGAFQDRVLIQSSTVSGNSSSGGTGGLYLRGAISIRHTTVTKNVGGGSRPGGVLAGDGAQQFELDHSIVAGNTHRTFGPPDILFFMSMPNVTIRASLIGDNTSTTLVEAPLGSPDGNGNLIGKPTSKGGQGVIDPVLGPLNLNGGRTRTHALLPGSPALDAGALVTGPPQGYDQRGNPFGRMVDGAGDGIVRIDMGSYESQGVPSFAIGDFNSDGQVDACDYVDFRDCLGMVVTPFACGDANGNGIVDYVDYELWKANFGSGLTFSSGGGGASLAPDAEQPAEWQVIPVGPLQVTAPASAATRTIASQVALAVTGRTNDDALLAWLSSQADSVSVTEESDTSPLAGEADEEPADFCPVLDAAFSTL